jgi:hypothetical protein
MGTINAKHHQEPSYKTQVKARRCNHMTFLHLLCKQGVAGSNPATSTRTLLLSLPKLKLQLRPRKSHGCKFVVPKAEERNVARDGSSNWEFRLTCVCLYSS